MGVNLSLVAVITILLCDCTEATVSRREYQHTRRRRTRQDPGAACVANHVASNCSGVSDAVCCAPWGTGSWGGNPYAVTGHCYSGGACYDGADGGVANPNKLCVRYENATGGHLADWSILCTMCPYEVGGRDPPHSCPTRKPGLLTAVSYTHLTLPTICSV